MNKTIIITSFSIVLALVIGIVSSSAIVEAVEPLEKIIIANGIARPVPLTITNLPTDPVCSADKIQHWYTIKVRHSNNYMELRSPTHPTIVYGLERVINFNVNSDDVFYIQHLIIDRLTELGYVAYDIHTYTSRPLTYSDTWVGPMSSEEILPSHTTICANS